MKLEEFKSSIADANPPKGIEKIAEALWYDAKGNWDKAHDIAQDEHSAAGSWMHAYLHRKEGDIGNASYWYSKAGRKLPSYSLEQEWEELVKTFL